MVFEDRHELGSAVDLDTLDLEGRAAEELVEQVLGGAGGCAVATWPTVHLATGS